jgi:DNA replication protein DnaC
MADAEEITTEEEAVVEPEPIQPDFIARAAEMQRLSNLKRDKLAGLVEAVKAGHEVYELCPRQPETCKGEPLIYLPGEPGEGSRGFSVVCPLHYTGDCPGFAKQTAANDRSFLRGLLRMSYDEDSELLHATLADVTVAFRPAVEKWVETAPERLRRGEGLILTGGVGSGKSSACMLLAVAAHRAGADVCYLESGQAFDELYSGKYDLLEPDADLLILDDFGYEYRSEVVMPRFHSLMNRRWHTKKATVFGSMLTSTTLEADVKLSAVFSRLRQRNPWKETGQEDRRQHAQLEDWA